MTVAYTESGAIRPGLASVTFRDLSPEAIIECVASSGLQGIEWGGDVHVPHGDVDLAGHVGDATRAAGLAVSSYGSYYRLGHSEEEGLSFQSVLRTALALQAPLIRVWPGKQASADSDDAYRRRVADDFRRVAGLAADAGLAVASEYHSHSLTDTPESALAFIEETGHANARLYWQMRIGDTFEALQAELERVIPYLANLHVFCIRETPEREQCPLSDGRDDWCTFFDTVRGAVAGSRWALLEFVAGGSRQQFEADARTLVELLDGNS